MKLIFLTNSYNIFKLVHPENTIYELLNKCCRRGERSALHTVHKFWQFQWFLVINVLYGQFAKEAVCF